MYGMKVRMEHAKWCHYGVVSFTVSAQQTLDHQETHLPHRQQEKK